MSCGIVKDIFNDDARMRPQLIPRNSSGLGPGPAGVTPVFGVEGMYPGFVAHPIMMMGQQQGETGCTNCREKLLIAAIIGVGLYVYMRK